MSNTLDYLKIVDLEKAMASCIDKQITIEFIDEMSGKYYPLTRALLQRSAVATQYFKGTSISEENKRHLIDQFIHLNMIICQTLGIPTNCF